MSKRHILIPLLVGSALLVACAPRIDDPRFRSLPEEEKVDIIRSLHERKLWGRPQYKPVYREIIAGQVSENISPDDVARAIDVVEEYGWRDMDGLIRAAYDHPTDIIVYRRAFMYLSKCAGATAPQDLLDAVFIVGEYGNWSPDGFSQSIGAKELKAAQKRLIQETNKEMILAYVLFLAAQPDDPPQPSAIAAVDVLRTLDQRMVRSRLQSFQLRRDPLQRRRAALRWVATQLGIEGRQDEIWSSQRVQSDAASR